MKVDDAKKMLEAARVKAAEIGKPVSVAIVDTAGAMVLFERVNNAAAFTAIVAEGKASASALTGRDSVLLGQMAQNNPALVNALIARMGGRFVAAQGAIALRDANNDVAGAIGVSGATGEEDEQIAKAGAASFSA